MAGQVEATKQAMLNGTYTCKLPCQSNMKAIAGGCCDDVWTPYIAFSNIKWLPQVRGGERGGESEGE